MMKNPFHHRRGFDAGNDVYERTNVASAWMRESDNFQRPTVTGFGINLGRMNVGYGALAGIGSFDYAFQAPSLRLMTVWRSEGLLFSSDPERLPRPATVTY